jgi:ABC-type polar amino acid transport system ATPase subunit
MSDQISKRKLIGIVGPCSAGKTTLITNLNKYGYKARHIAQEHSYVQDMWKRLVDPIVLIYLDVSYPVSIRRRSMNLSQREFDEQRERLAHAHDNANLYIHTDTLSPIEIIRKVLNFLEKMNIEPQEK